MPVRFEPREQLDRAANGAQHQGVIAYGAAERYATLEESAAAGGLHVVLDGVEDPHNLGAIIRSAHAAGASAVVIPERRAAGLTETVARAAAGALAYLPIVRVTNINRALEDLKKHGYWIYGLDERGTETYDQVEFTRPSAIVLGAEGRGLHEQVAKHCDFLVRIPMAGEALPPREGQHPQRGAPSGPRGTSRPRPSTPPRAESAASGVASLNVSVAAGVMLFEWKRRAH